MKTRIEKLKMMFLLMGGVALIFLNETLAEEVEGVAHTFTGTDGRKLTAFVVSKTADSVTIRRVKDDKEFVVQLKKISKADREFVRSWGEDEVLAPSTTSVKSLAKTQMADPAKEESWVIPPNYENAQDFVRMPGMTGPMFATFEIGFKSGRKTVDMRTGLIRSDGLVLCDPVKYEDFPMLFLSKGAGFGPRNTANYFRYHNVFPKLIGGKYGLVNTDGQEVVAPKWDWVGTISEGLFDIKVDGKYGYANLRGETIIEPQWASVGAFFGGYAWVREKKRGKMRVIDQSGKVVSDQEWDSVTRPLSFGWGLENSDDESWFDDIQNDYPIGVFWVEVDGNWGLHDFKKGESLGGLQWDKRGDAFRDGKSWVQRDSKFGMINMAGKVVMEPEWEGSKSGKSLKPPKLLGGFIGTTTDEGEKWFHLDGTPLPQDAKLKSIIYLQYRMVVRNGELEKMEMEETPSKILISRDDAVSFVDGSGKPEGPQWKRLWSTSLPDYFIVEDEVDGEKAMGLVSEKGAVIETPKWKRQMRFSYVEIEEGTEVPDGELIAAFWNEEGKPGALFVKTKEKLVKVEWKNPSRKLSSSSSTEANSIGAYQTVKKHSKDDIKTLRESGKRPKWGYIRLVE